ncbi:MAG: TIR domain-containing protein [Bauldia sp.]
MKAFISHSSANHIVAREIADYLGAADVELDALTFDAGVLNSSAIVAALKRSSVFVLLLSDAAAASKFVQYEMASAEELRARGLIDRFLIFVIDGASFDLLADEWKKYNVVRRELSPSGIGRMIQAALISSNAVLQGKEHPFVGRGAQLHDVKEALVDPKRTQTKAVFVSGNAGVGRRTFARRLYSEVYPSVNQVMPEILIEQFDGLEEIYRKVLGINHSPHQISTLRTRIQAFQIADETERLRLIAQLLARSIEDREAIVFRDAGGLLGDDGSLQYAIGSILSRAEKTFYPPIVFIAERAVPAAVRRNFPGIVFCPLPALDRAAARQLMGFGLQKKNVPYTAEELDNLVELSDSHPFNIAFIVEGASQYTIPVFLDDLSAFTQWKRKRGAEFLQKIDFSPAECRILYALKDFRGLDFPTLAKLVSAKDIGPSMSRLLDYHIVEASNGTYSVSPPLRAAVGRDGRFVLKSSDQKEVLNGISEVLKTLDEGSRVPVSLLDAAVLASLQDKQAIPDLFSAFLLPSHLVWLARRRYDEKDNRDCVRLAREALRSLGRLSEPGKIEAARLLCLAAARLGRDDEFEFGIGVLRTLPQTPIIRSNIAFLQGFKARLEGNLPNAEARFRESLSFSKGNFHAARELASVCSTRGDFETAEVFARQALEVAPDNPYILDILLEILINIPSKRAARDPEIDYLFDKLKAVGEEAGHSFYTTRRAEFEWLSKNRPEAVALIDKARERTPGIFSVRALRAQIYLDMGNKTVAADELREMESIVFDAQSSERRSNMRAYLEVKSKYLTAIGDFGSASAVFANRNVFTKDEADAAQRAIDTERAYRQR